MATENDQFQRKCSECGVVKPLSEFPTDKAKKFGKKYRCKICSTAKNKKKYTENKEYYQEYYQGNKEEKKVYTRKYYQGHKDQYTPEYRNRNGNYHPTTSKYSMQYYENNREAILAKCKIYYEYKNAFIALIHIKLTEA